VFTPRELADLTALSLRTISRLTAAGKIPGSMKVGGSRRYNRQKIIAWLERGATSTGKFRSL
jgi:excisionase family DNA binding protein